MSRSEDFPRRRLLGLGAMLPLLAACTPGPPLTSDPTRTPSPTGTSPAPSPSPTPTHPPPVVPGARAAATTELTLAGLARAILSSRRSGALTKDQRSLLTFLVRAHQAHAAALAVPTPTPKPPVIGSLTLDGSLARLATSEAAAATSHRAATLAVTGLDAARLGGMAAAAALYSRVVTLDDPVPLATPTTRVDFPLRTDVEAVQSLVAQLHALVYGYQLAIGRMPVAGRRDDQAKGELLQHRIRRDRMIGWLRLRQAEVPVPEPAYRPSVEVRDGRTGARLVRTMLVALQPFAGIWLAAAAENDREWALTFYLTTVDLARAWDAPLPIWPGGTR